MIALAALVVVLAGSGEPRLMRVTASSVWPTPTDGGSAWVGVLKLGAVVEVEGCHDSGRALLAGGRASAGCGVFADAPDAEAAAANEPPLRWGSVRTTAQLRARPRADAGVLETVVAPHTLALTDDALLAAGAWARRASGGFVRLSDVRLDRPRTFAGVARPRLPLAFALRATARALPAPIEGPAEPVPRHARFDVLSFDGTRVMTADGALPRRDVRLAVARARPPAVPPGARWVNVELAEQVLTAYEGDVPVYATLVSAGIGDTPEHRTRTGLFRVWLESLHDRMHGDGYFVEEVPWIMYFAGSQGLHAAFWHDAFGRPASHGCVNLSPTDARWLFEWAPPRLPPGWHTVAPLALGVETLWVHVERAKPAPALPRLASE